MFQIPCPWCGPREQQEFRCGGEGHIVRPRDPASLDDAAWADYVFMRKNPKGIHRDLWNHVHGCRRWFYLARDTVSDAVLAVYKIGEPVPEVGADTAAGRAETAEPGR